MTGTLRVKRGMVDLITSWGHFSQTEPRGGWKKKKESIIDKQGEIKATILWLFVIHGDSIKLIDNICLEMTFKSYALG